MAINLYVKQSTKKQIIEYNDYSGLKDIDCIIILGAGIWGDKPSPMLEDRLLQGIELYKEGVAPKIIMSGDHGRENYDEVNVTIDGKVYPGIILDTCGACYRDQRLDLFVKDGNSAIHRGYMGRNMINVEITKKK